jgi:hypothetical protein
MIIQYPVTSFKNQNGDIMGNIDFSKLESEAWETFGIFDLTSFLNAISILDNPEITLEDGVIIAHDDDSEIRYISSDPETLESTMGKESVVNSTVEARSIVEIDIDTKLMQKVRKGAGVFKNLKDLIIVKDNDGVRFTTGNTNSTEIMTNSYSITLHPNLEEDKQFSIAIPIENFLALPQMDYTMGIKYNEERDAYRIVFTNSIFKFVLAIKA